MRNTTHENWLIKACSHWFCRDKLEYNEELKQVVTDEEVETIRASLSEAEEWCDGFSLSLSHLLVSDFCLCLPA